MKKWICGALLSTLLILFLASATNVQERRFEVSKSLDVFYSIFRELDLFYVDSLPLQKTMNTAVEAMLGSIDPYTEYYTEENTSDLRIMTTGEYGGIGATILNRQDKIIISEPYEGKPAQRAGLRPGDQILSIDGKSTEKLTVSQTSNLLKGIPGTPIELIARRNGTKDPITFRFNRERIQVDPVNYVGVVAPGVGYISIETFNDKTADQVRAGFDQLRMKHAIESLIIDLRNNGGGVMEEAISIANLFIGKGNVIVSTRGKVAQMDKTYRTTTTPIDTLIPIAVMVNSGSASASEILAGAIQDLDRGIIVGNRTFGKGLVQSTRELPYNGFLKLTIAKYYTPSGRCVQALDYSNRRKDGSVGKIPDHLISTFYTRNRRPVKDGGGITPDLEASPDETPSILYYLAEELLLFDYANDYTQRHKTLPDSTAFTLPDSEYEQFKQMAIDRKFTYDRNSEKALKTLREIVKQEGYYEDARSEFEALERKLTHDTAYALNLFKPQIKFYLEQEIIRRYYHQRGSIESSFRKDKVLIETIKRLQNKEQYASILKGNKQ